MGKQDQIGLGRFDYLFKADRKAVRSVLVEQIVFDEEHFVELKAGEFIGKRGHAFANHNGCERAAWPAE